MIIEKLSNAFGAAGDEDEIRNLIKEYIKDHVEKMEINPIGNLITYKNFNSKENVLITAHMDEVALIVKKIQENGLIKFYNIGGFIPKILPGNTVLIGKNRIPGVIGLKTLHVTTPEERNRTMSIKEMFIDVGASSNNEIKNISPGDYIYFNSKFFVQNEYFFGKAFDDRAGCAAIINILQNVNKCNCNIIGVFTVQEEVGLRGGAVAAYNHKNIKFNLNLEGTTCSDRELTSDYTPSTELGKGPAITLMDRTSIANRKLVDFVVSIAEKNNIPYQFKRSVTGGTDAGFIHLTEEGIPSITISVPVRYIHSPWSIMYSKDFENYLNLSKLIIENADKFQEK